MTNLQKTLKNGNLDEKIKIFVFDFGFFELNLLFGPNNVDWAKTGVKMQFLIDLEHFEIGNFVN